MKKISFFISIITFLGLLLIIKIVEGKGETILVSPLPKTAGTMGLNQWKPKDVLGLQIGAPEISAKSAIFLSSKDGKVLYAKNIHERMPIASLTKVMTVLVALDNKKMDDKYVISKTAADTEPDKMFLIEGETLTLKELLSGIFLVSANDAAEAIAEGTTGVRAEFIAMMNSKALQLGMKDTYYVNPTGLDEDDNNSYSSAYDQAILTRYLIRMHPQVVDISSTYHIYLPQTQTHQDYDMYSGINLLTTYPGVVGFKTGYTPNAGLTFIVLARKNGQDLPLQDLRPAGRQEVIGVLLNSEYRRDEARELLDYSFAEL